MNKAISLTIALASLAGPAMAQPPRANPDPAAAQAGAYVVEPTHTRVTFSVDHLGFTDYNGDFTGASGSLTLDPQNVEAAVVDVTVPTDTLSTTNAQLDTMLKGGQFLNVPAFPTMHFKSTHVEKTGAGTALVTGDLTIHGVTKPETFTVQFHGSGVDAFTKAYTVGFGLTGTIKRSDFGVGYGVPLIGDDVTLRIAAPFIRK